MQPFALSLLLVETQPSHSSAHQLERINSLRRILEALEQQPRATLSFYASVPLLRQLYRLPGMPDMLRQLGHEGRLEGLAGGTQRPLFPALPPREAELTLAQSRQTLQSLLTQPPRVAFLAGHVWEPELCPILSSQNLSAAVLTEAQLRSCVPRLGRFATSLHITEQQGFPVKLVGAWTLEALAECQLPSNDALPPGLLPEGLEGYIEALLEHAQGRGAQSEGAGVLMITLDELLLPSVFATLENLLREGHAHRGALSLTTLSQRIQHEPGARIYPGSSMSPRAAARWSWTAEGVRRESPEPSVGWQRLLLAQPFLNRYHKRLLWLWSRLSRAERVLNERRGRAEPVGGLESLLDQIRSLLLEASAVEFWGLDGQDLCLESGTRERSHALLLEANQRLERILWPEPNFVALERLDLDRDGLEEVQVSTPGWEGLISRRGGILYQAALKNPAVLVGEVPSRSPAPYHQPLLAVGISAQGKKSPRPLSFSPELALLAKHLRRDVTPRGLFVDHVLAPGATPENLYAGQFPVLASLPEQTYEVLSATYTREAGEAQILLARSLWLESGPGQPPGAPTSAALYGTVSASAGNPPSGGSLEAREVRASLRVEKRFVFPDHGQTLEVHYRLINRGHTPLTLQFASELSFTAAWQVSEVWLGDEAHAWQEAQPQPDMPGERVNLGGVTRLHVRTRADATPSALSLQLSKEAELWSFLQELILPGRSGGLRVESVGRVLLFQWPVSLWGEEQTTLSLRLSRLPVADSEHVQIEILD